MLDYISIITQECQSATVQTGQIHHLISCGFSGDHLALVVFFSAISQCRAALFD